MKRQAVTELCWYLMLSIKFAQIIVALSFLLFLWIISVLIGLIKNKQHNDTSFQKSLKLQSDPSFQHYWADFIPYTIPQKLLSSLPKGLCFAKLCGLDSFGSLAFCPYVRHVWYHYGVKALWHGNRILKLSAGIWWCHRVRDLLCIFSHMSHFSCHLTCVW